MGTRTCIHPFFLPSPHRTTPAVSHPLSSSAIAGLSLRHQLRFFLASALFWKHLDLLHHTYILSLRFKKKNSPSSVLRLLWLFEIEGSEWSSMKAFCPISLFPAWCNWTQALILQLQSTRVLFYTVVVARGSFAHLFPHESSFLRWPPYKVKIRFLLAKPSFITVQIFELYVSLGAISPLKSHIEPRWFRLWSFLTAALALKKIFFSQRSTFAALNSIAIR
jgi:hypothetical protein